MSRSIRVYWAQPDPAGNALTHFEAYLISFDPVDLPNTQAQGSL